jgi:hypothetical protein
LNRSQANIKVYNDELQIAVKKILEVGKGLDYFRLKAACELALERKLSNGHRSKK